MSPRRFFDTLVAKHIKQETDYKELDCEETSFDEAEFSDFVVSADNVVSTDNKESSSSRNSEGLEKHVDEIRQANHKLESVVVELKEQAAVHQGTILKLLAADSRNQRFKLGVAAAIKELRSRVGDLEANDECDKGNSVGKKRDKRENGTDVVNRHQDILATFLNQIDECLKEAEKTHVHMTSFHGLIDKASSSPN